MRIIPYNDEVLGEVRDALFLKGLGRDAEKTRIVAFGSCNFSCPYCMRDAQFIDSNGNVLKSVEVDEREIFHRLENAIANGERIRLSGGDPCMHIRDSLKIAQWATKRGRQISYCHNGSSPALTSRLAPYAAHAAIDLKAVSIDEFVLRTGIDKPVASKVMKNFHKVCRAVLSNESTLLDVRTCVFSTTTLKDLFEMAQMISQLAHDDRVFWTIRQYDPVATIDWQPLRQGILDEWLSIISRKYPILHIGYRSQWVGGVFYHWYSGNKTQL